MKEIRWQVKKKHSWGMRFLSNKKQFFLNLRLQNTNTYVIRVTSYWFKKLKLRSWNFTLNFEWSRPYFRRLRVLTKLPIFFNILTQIFSSKINKTKTVTRINVQLRSFWNWKGTLNQIMTKSSLRYFWKLLTFPLILRPRNTDILVLQALFDVGFFKPYFVVFRS